MVQRYVSSQPLIRSYFKTVGVSQIEIVNNKQKTSIRGGPTLFLSVDFVNILPKKGGGQTLMSTKVLINLTLVFQKPPIPGAQIVGRNYIP